MSREPGVTVYGTATCMDCRRSRVLLDGEQVDYRYIGIDEDAAAAEFVLLGSGRTSTPYIVFKDGSTQIEPTDADLLTRLISLGLADAR